VSPFLFEIFSIHLPCSWSQHARPYMFHFFKITSRISPDESTWRHVQALTVFLCKHSSECLSAICCTSIEFGISLRVYKWRWVAFDSTLGFAFLWFCSTLIEVRIMYATSTFAEYVFSWNVIVINISFLTEVAENILSELDKSNNKNMIINKSYTQNNYTISCHIK